MGKSTFGQFSGTLPNGGDFFTNFGHNIVIVTAATVPALSSSLSSSITALSGVFSDAGYATLSGSTKTTVSATLHTAGKI